MLKAVVVASEDIVSKDLADKLNNYFAERVCFEALSLTADVTGDIRRKDADLLVTVDLAGFDRTTFTDGIAYNLLDCKQIHLLLHEKLSNEKHLKNLLSMAMFFVCTGETYAEYLQYRYSNIPWLKALPVLWSEWDQEAADEWISRLCGLIEEVLRECRLI